MKSPSVPPRPSIRALSTTALPRTTRSPSEFAGLACGSFAAAFVGVLIFIRGGILIHRLFWGGENVPSAASSERRNLSAEQKKEIDDLRSTAIHRHLKKFSSTLNEHGVEGQQPSQPTAADTGKRFLYQTLSTNDNISAELSKDGGEKKLATKAADEEESSEVIDIVADADDVENEKKGNPQLSIPFLPIHGSDALQCTKKSKTCDTSTQKLFCNTPPCLHVKDHKLLECAICQEEYKPSDKVCWSSNSKCKHVFHEECIAQWLVSLGWMKLKENRVRPEHLIKDEKNLLSYDLECPVCRQQFVDKSILIAASDDDVESKDRRGDECV